MKSIADELRELGACQEAIVWAEPYGDQRAKAWEECRNASWMIWLIGTISQCERWTDRRKPLLTCTLDCAMTVAHLWPEKSEEKIGGVVKALRGWIAGKIDTEEAKAARRELHAAYAAAADAQSAAAYDAFACVAYAAAAAAAQSAAAAADDDAARLAAQAKCADIVRQHFPKPPRIAKE